MCTLYRRGFIIIIIVIVITLIIRLIMIILITGEASPLEPCLIWDAYASYIIRVYD